MCRLVAYSSDVSHLKGVRTMNIIHINTSLSYGMFTVDEQLVRSSKDYKTTTVLKRKYILFAKIRKGQHLHKLDSVFPDFAYKISGVTFYNPLIICGTCYFTTKRKATCIAYYQVALFLLQHLIKL